MGETEDELVGAMTDLRNVGVNILTLGQYLRPSAQHLPVARFYHPDEFAELAERGHEMGFAHVESGPLVRSSYHAKKQTDLAHPPQWPGEVQAKASRADKELPGEVPPKVSRAD
jgi:lipoic acid synthetase